MKNKWYTLHVLSTKEKQAKENILIMAKKEGLETKIEEIFMATEQLVEIRKGEKKKREKKIFPGYLFINVDLKNEDGKVNKDLYTKIKSCNNVINFLGGENPNPVNDEEIKVLKEKAQKMSETPTLQSEFKVGEMIRIKQGPFESHQGEITAINSEKGKLQIMVTIFDRQTTLDNIEYWQVEKLQ